MVRIFLPYLFDDLAATEGKVSSDKDLTAEEAAALGYPDGGGTFMMIKPGTQKWMDECS